MNEKFAPRIGAVFSADIAVPDHERVVHFYARVLVTGEEPLWQEEGLLNNLGMPVIGIGRREAGFADLPLQWMPHIQVADIVASVKAAEDLGGSVIMHGKDEEGNSQWAVLGDPNGAAFGIIPLIPAEAVAQMTGATPIDEGAPVGHIAWLDLTVPNAGEICDFYKRVVGWQSDEVPLQDGDQAYADFLLIDGNGAPSAGVCHARGQNLGLPPVWMLYLPVGDIEESLRRAEAEGGKVVKLVRNDAGEPVYAAVTDPVGVAFAVVPG
jgi:predicted enzyme related to lactoylglutathione lyase